MMKKKISILFILLGILSGCSKNGEKSVDVEVQVEEVTLFDKETKPVVYIDYSDDKPTFYTWDGIPEAYLDEDNEIYHFKGQFLGWYIDGVVYNIEGYAVAAKKGVVRGEIIMSQTYAESAIKGVKHLKPVPYLRSLPPLTPRFKDEWSTKGNVLTHFFLIEVTLFDKDKMAIAYVDYSDKSTIYMWNGTPVAYVEEEENIYHFDGRFLGWYVDGIVYDKNGYAVAAEKGVLKGEISMITTQMLPMKSLKHSKPIKQVQSLKPTTRPNFEKKWSEISLTAFFLSE